MLDTFAPISPFDITDNVFHLLDRDWMLITAGSPEHFNTMTASWGHLGVLWNLPVAIIYIRPQRYTFGFVNEHDAYTLSFFGKEYRKALRFCGSHSGRDYDKIKETGLTPLETDRGEVTYREARLVLECRKLYQDDLKEEQFLVPEVVKKNYPTHDFHRFYMGEILQAYLKK